MFVLVTWGNWTECSAECDGGIQARDKFCNGSLCGKVEGSCHFMPCDGKSQLTSYLRQQTSLSSLMCTIDTPQKMDHVALHVEIR